MSHLLNEDSGHLSIHCRRTSCPQQPSHAHAQADTVLHHKRMARSAMEVNAHAA